MTHARVRFQESFSSINMAEELSCEPYYYVMTTAFHVFDQQYVCCVVCATRW